VGSVSGGGDREEAYEKDEGQRERVGFPGLKVETWGTRR